MLNLYILSGQTNSGKTTFLEDMIRNKLQLYSGILCPKADGKRYGYLIHEDRKIEIEAQNHKDDDEVLRVGKYFFSKAAMADINLSIINNGIKKGKTVIIDEIGPLELKNQGFYDSVISVMAQAGIKNLKAIFVIREKLLNEAIHFFNLSPIKVIEKKTRQLLRQL